MRHRRQNTRFRQRAAAVQDRTDNELKKLANDHLEPILALLVK